MKLIEIKEILRTASVEVDIQGRKHLALFESDFERVAIELVEKLTLTDVGCSLCIDDEVADVLVEKIYKKNKKDLQYLTSNEGVFKAGLAHGLLSKVRLHK